MGEAKRALVTGAGGFVGHHLVRALKARGYWVRGADLKEPEYEPSPADEFELRDLRRPDECLAAARRVDEVYNLAADMGGIGYISGNHSTISRNNVLINTHVLEAARVQGVPRVFFSSSACIYPMYKQQDPEVVALKEEDAMPADPEEGYGWEKLFSERMYVYYGRDFGMHTRVARFHNIYGPLGTYEGGKEKVPAAMCRKVALAPEGGELEIWGDGLQTRSFMHVRDCVEGIYRLMQSDHPDPLNLGTDELITINDLADLVLSASGKELRKAHDLDRPQGVRGRNSDNTRLEEVLDWKPEISLEEGLRETYAWIRDELGRAGRLPG